MHAYKLHWTGVDFDPLGQPTVTIGTRVALFRLILKSTDRRTDILMTFVKINPTILTMGRPRGSIGYLTVAGHLPKWPKYVVRQV